MRGSTSNARAASAAWIAMSASVSASGSMLTVVSAKNFTSFFSSIMYMPVARLDVGRGCPGSAAPGGSCRGRAPSARRPGRRRRRARPSSCRSGCAGSSGRAALAGVTPLRWRSSRVLVRVAPSARRLRRDSSISTPVEIEVQISRRAGGSRFASRAGSGCAIPSSSDDLAGAQHLDVVALGEHDALRRALRALRRCGS